ncbi:hypothetical protein P0136_10445 [Lentisphaerota bacterium ZTH]|nr:hypothetical protein JYG24_12045 [Lentisphaerota bacterium]WET05780.1 hypothetical protein P0136_10445 [Lentisphaerota bacterium ZTH]
MNLLKKIARVLGCRIMRLRGDERGLVVYYTAFLACFCLALFSIAYDTSIISQQKMQMQNAADAAAMEMAVWQSRGMNLVQGLNMDIHDLDEVAAWTLGLLSPMELAAWLLQFIPFVGPSLRSGAEAGLAPIIMGAMSIHEILVNYFLKPVREMYTYGSNVMGYIAANNAAEANNASPIIDVSLPGADSSNAIVKLIMGGLQGLIKKFRAVGIPTDLKTFYKLPLEAKYDKASLFGGPMNLTGNIGYKAAVAILKWNQHVPGYIKNNWEWVWNDPYYVSEEPYGMDGKKPLSPWIWFCYKKVNVGNISSYFLFAPGTKAPDNPQKIPAIAYAVGQARGGNVIRYNSWTHNHRPWTWGTGTDAFLVPLDKVSDNMVIKAASKVFLH